MGERVWFATSNWKDKPNKPSCYTQAEWDARNSSKFNGAPFAGNFAFDPTKTTVKGLSQADFDAYKNAVQAISQPGCPFIGSQLMIAQQNLPKLKETDIPVTCQDAEMKVWDGSTYYDRSGAIKTFTWTTCNSGKSRSMTIGVEDFKAPSASTKAYIPVCGPGTHIKEITKDELMKIVWRVAEFDLDASGFSAKVDKEWSMNLSSSNPYNNCDTQYWAKSSCTVTTSNKNLDPSSSSLGKESDIVKSKWAACPERGYTGKDSMSVSSVGTIYTDGPYGTGNGNVTVSASLPSTAYKCGNIAMVGSGEVKISIKPFADRQQYIYFVPDSASGVEKIYFDPTGLFNFSIVCNGANYYLDPTNQSARFTLTLNLLGKNYTLKVSGPPNGSSQIPLTLGAGGGGWGFGNQFGTQAIAFTSGTVTISPKKYYPYANSKGEAVYDEDTGAQLKDPLS
jgi:hypothetical protein